MIEQSHICQDEVFDIINNQFSPAHPMRLSHALNQANFYYEMLNQPEQANRLAQQVCYFV